MIISKLNIFVLLSVITTVLTSAINTVPTTTSTTPTSMPTTTTLPVGSLPPLPSDLFDFDYYVPFRSEAHDQFCWQLLKQVLCEQQQKNVIISPFSVKLMLSMLSEAAGNNTLTQKELLGTLTDIQSSENLRNFYKKNLMALRQKNPFYTLNLSTKVYTAQYIEPQQRFAALLHEFYATDIERLDFANASLASHIINDWSSAATAGKLQNLVSEESIKNSVMILANVIYFNGLWRRPFEDNFEGVFFKSQKEQMRVNYMELTDYFYYHNSAAVNAKLLRLPYKGRQYSMFILLPKTEVSVQQLFTLLDNESLKRMQLLMEDTKVKLTMPKFKFEYEHNMRETLGKLGINDIFSDQASLPGLARGAQVANRLKVSNMFQKAGIEVNENGTEIFASTVVEIGNKFGGVSIIEEFNVNRPFIFFIEEESTGNIIFAGKVNEPFL